MEQSDTLKKLGEFQLVCHRANSWWDGFRQVYFPKFINKLFPPRYHQVWDTGFIKNTMCNVGKAASAGLLVNVGGVTAFGYLALGTSSTAPTAADTTLGAEISTNGLSRSLATASRVQVNVTNDTAQLFYEFTATGSSTVEEIGIFNASSSGVMLCHGLTTSRTVQNTDKVDATYKVTQA